MYSYMQNHIEDRIEAYIAGMLGPDSLIIFERHIGECRRCTKALRETEDAQACLKWLVPLEPPPQPGPEFYARVQQSIGKKLDTGWLGSLAAALQGPRLAFPLLFVFLGLILTAWTMSWQADAGEISVLGIPPAQYSDRISTDADRLFNRDLVMISLVETPEND